MKIYVYPADEFGCGKYRMWWPSEALIDQGVDIVLGSPGSQTGIRGLKRDGKLREVWYPKDADIIVLQRPSHIWLSQAVPMMREKGVTVVVEMDDDLGNVHPANPAFRLMHPKQYPNANWQHVAFACREASMVICSTEALVPRYASHGRYRVIPNYVPERFLKIEHQDSDQIGWAGALHSHPDDPRALGPSLSRIRRELRVIGPEDPGLNRAFGCETNPTGVIPFDEWPNRVAELGVGLAPLMDTQFNKCKSWLKPLEYAAVGVPWVGSDAPEYMALYNRGCGMIATKPKEWERKVGHLVRSPEARQELSEAGRMVAAELTIEANAWRWLEAWTEAHEQDHR
jgi:glycosyltransferase involved in cell wall biosynthesis